MDIDMVDIVRRCVLKLNKAVERSRHKKEQIYKTKSLKRDTDNKEHTIDIIA